MFYCDDISALVFSHLPDLELVQWNVRWIKLVTVVHANSRFLSTEEQFSKMEQSNLVGDLGLSRELSEVIASCLNEKNCLRLGIKVTFNRCREQSCLDISRKKKILFIAMTLKCCFLKKGNT